MSPSCTTSAIAGDDEEFEALLAAERAALHATTGSPDATEGMMAFLEKRRPLFNRS